MKNAKHKKLSRASGITIPKDIRLELGFAPGIALDLMPTDAGELLIRKHTASCRFCGSPENVIKFRGEEICAQCAGLIAEEVKRHA